MAERPSVTDQALKKLADQLTCPICLEPYTSPKLLQCFHVFCEECLQNLARRGQHGSLTCPNCRRATQIPPGGVPALQPAFHIHHLSEIRDALKKMNVPQQIQCEKCKDSNATSYCRDCGKFICTFCTKVHEKWDEFKSHEVINLDQLKEDVTKLVPPKKTVSYCSKHKGEEEKLYCETCGELICRDCTVRLHQGHQYDLITDTFQKHKEELVASLTPVEQQLETVQKAIKGLDTLCQQITEQRAVLEVDICKTTRQLQESLEVRKTELIGEINQRTQQKLKSLAAQRDQFELMQTRLSSCLEYVKESLRTGSEGEVLGMKKPVTKQIEEVTAEFQPEVLVPKEEADLVFSCDAKVHPACQQFGVVHAKEASPKNCYMTGEGLKVARLGEDATSTLHVIDAWGEKYEEPIGNISCELVPTYDASTVRGSVEKRRVNRYEIRYRPTTRGQHQLHVKVEGEHVKGSPFNVTVKVPVEKLGTPIRTIDGLQGPWGVAVNERGEIIVAERNGHCVSIFSPQGEKIRSFGTKGSAPGQLNFPMGIDIDKDGNILVADYDNHRVQKFSPDGKFITSVGTRGSGPLQFNNPLYITVSQEGRVIVADNKNQRIQILNPDLTFHSSFGRPGTGNGQFSSPTGVAIDSKGNIFVADWEICCIQVFTRDGKFQRKFGEKGSEGGKVDRPTDIAIDSDDMVFVCEYINHRVSVFTSQGQFVRTIGARGDGPGQFKDPQGIAVDRHRFVYISDWSNNRLQIL